MASDRLKPTRALEIQLVILSLICTGNLVLILFTIPYLEGLYQLVLGGRLPLITSSILHYRILPGLVASAWLIAGTVLEHQGNRLTGIVVRGGILWCFLQAGFLLYGLFVPLVGLVGGMSDAPYGK